MKIEMIAIIEDVVEGRDHQVMIGINDAVVAIATDTITVVIEADHQETEEEATKKESVAADLLNKKAKAAWIENKDSVQTAMTGREDQKKDLKLQDETSVRKDKTKL